MQFAHAGHTPEVDADAWVAASAILRGNVRVGAGSVVLDGAVLSAESGAVEVGRDCVVMEYAVLRGTVRHPCRIGDAVLVGPHAHLSGCDIADGVFVATRASIFNGAHVGSGAEVRIGAVVHVNSKLAAGALVPIGWIAVGDPAQLFAPEQHEALWPVQRALGFSETVWGRAPSRDAAGGGKRASGDNTRRYARGLLRALRAKNTDDNPGFNRE